MQKEQLGGFQEEIKTQRWDTWKYKIGIYVRDFGCGAANYCRNKYNENFSRRIWARFMWFFWGVESLGDYLMYGDECMFGREAHRVIMPRLMSLIRE